jgi:4-diphosphocytidyl-2-C-methyl-D-erythritol kinase
MIVYPKCKINLGLNITSKRADGFHNLQSIFYPLNLSDILEIVKSDFFEMNITGLKINGEIRDNIITKAYHLLASKYDILPVKIHLHKIVPMGAGLGGGSANGAATLSVLNELFTLGLSVDTLKSYAAELGSDCPFFIENNPAFVSGRGEVVENINLCLSDYYIYLINPGIHVGTKEAFAKIRPKHAAFDLSKLTVNELENWSNLVVNDFETGIFESYPILKKIKTDLYANGAIYASMTGTGSSLYGIFKKEPTSLYPDYFEWISKL